jgi:hypothetical protein
LESSNTFKYFFCKKIVATAKSSQVLGSSETDVKTEFVIVVFNRNKKIAPQK